jgi:DNA-binding response OmpR family regulator
VTGLPAHDLIAALRARPVARRPYIIYMTTDQHAPECARALSLGADSIFTKPFDRELLEAALPRGLRAA